MAWKYSGTWAYCQKATECLGCKKEIKDGNLAFEHFYKSSNSSSGFYWCVKCTKLHGKPGVGTPAYPTPEELIVLVGEYLAIKKSGVPVAASKRGTIISYAIPKGHPEGFVCKDLRKKVRNPWHNPKLRKLNGLHPDVQEFVRQCLGTQKILHSTFNSKTAYGCHGGKHRSVAMAEIAAAYWRGKGWEIEVIHRDLKEVNDGSPC